jgi:hypothetical protein
VDGVRLLVLATCEGARASSTQPLVGVAHNALRHVPAVVAMQHPVTDAVARRFAYELYRCLAVRYPVDAAASEARNALYIDYGRNWGTPVLFLRSGDGRLFGAAVTPAAQTDSSQQVTAYLGRDPIVVLSGYTGEQLDQALARLQEIFGQGGAGLRADAGKARLTVRGRAPPSVVLSEEAAQALSGRSAQQADRRAYLSALLVDPRYGRWSRQYVPLAGRMSRTPGEMDVPPVYASLEVSGHGAGRQVRRVRLDDITQATAAHEALVLLGEPGAGKTTTLLKLALDAAGTYLDGTGKRIPLFISLAD